jgi:coenzyme F420-reducing hydrogenase beta subunit
MKEEPNNCLACGYIGHDHAEEDECSECNHRYNPSEVGEECPECGSGVYELVCPKCDASGGDYAAISTMPGYVNKKAYRATH